MHLICANSHVIVASSEVSGKIPIAAGGIRILLQKSHYKLVQGALQSSGWPDEQRSLIIVPEACSGISAVTSLSSCFLLK